MSERACVLCCQNTGEIIFISYSKLMAFSGFIIKFYRNISRLNFINHLNTDDAVQLGEKITYEDTTAHLYCLVS